jgi:hypothetical protein
MDLPPCPVCGGDLEQASPRAHARCPSCGFTTPVELDATALRRLLLEAAPSAGRLDRALEGPEMVADRVLVEARRPPSLAAPAPMARPELAPPAPPRELAARSPPPIADPRAPLLDGRDASTPLRDAKGEVDARRRRELAARGELLR